MGSWKRMRLDQGVRARFADEGEVVIEQWTQFMGRLSIDRCRVEILPLEAHHRRESPAGGALLVCHFFVPTAKQAVKVLTGLFMLALGLALAIGILRDARADGGAKALFLSCAGAMAILGVQGLFRVRPRDRLSLVECSGVAARVPAFGARHTAAETAGPLPSACQDRSMRGWSTSDPRVANVGPSDWE